MNNDKLGLISRYVSQHNIDFCFVQETLISREDSIKSLSSLWRGPSFWSPAIGCQGGVAILGSGNFEGEIKTLKKDSNGRVLSVQISYEQVNFNLVNVYAPTYFTDRNSFFQSVHQYFIPHSRLIFGGDLNCYDNSRDKFGGNITISTELSNFKSCFNLTDAWCSKHPRVSQCTWFNSDLSIGSRLHSFLVCC